MKRPRPVIAITCGNSSASGQTARYGANQVYIDAVDIGGGIPVMLPPVRHFSPNEVINHVDALLLPGGADVHPRFYGAVPGEHVERTDEERDEMEIALVLAARRKGKPVLGICRGLQTINVAFGGTLYQDLPTELGTDILHDVRTGAGRATIAHPIDIEPGSWLADASGRRRLEVNSLHHQAAREIGRGLRVTATSPDGVVEGLETADRQTVAMQCHAEELIAAPWARRVFRAFVDSARH